MRSYANFYLSQRNSSSKRKWYQGGLVNPLGDSFKFKIPKTWPLALCMYSLSSTSVAVKNLSSQLYQDFQMGASFYLSYIKHFYFIILWNMDASLNKEYWVIYLENICTNRRPKEMCELTKDWFSVTCIKTFNIKLGKSVRRYS